MVTGERSSKISINGSLKKLSLQAITCICSSPGEEGVNKKGSYYRLL